MGRSSGLVSCGEGGEEIVPSCPSALEGERLEVRRVLIHNRGPCPCVDLLRPSIHSDRGDEGVRQLVVLGFFLVDTSSPSGLGTARTMGNQP